MNAPDLLLLCATRLECRQIAEAMSVESMAERLGAISMRGAIRGRRCRLVAGGIGMVNTAVALTRELEAARPDRVLQFGIAGAFAPAGLAIGQVACATEEIYGEVGVLAPDGWHPADLIGIPLVPGDPPRFNRFPLDPGGVNEMARICDARPGPFLTLSQCTGVKSLGDELYRRFRAICETMEGASAAHVCALYDVPFFELRGVSNLVEDRDRSTWRIAQAVDSVETAVLRWIDSLAGRSSKDVS